MKSSLLVALMSLLLVSCDALRTVYVDIESQSTIAASPIAGTGLPAIIGFDDFVNFDVSSHQEFKNNNAGKEHIGVAFVTLFKLEVDSPEQQTLEFIDELEVFIGNTRVAYLDPSQNTQTRSLLLTTYSDRDIGHYLRADKTEVTVKAKGSPPAKETTITATIQFEIKLQI